jgi:hypothetical protein
MVQVPRSLPKLKVYFLDSDAVRKLKIYLVHSHSNNVLVHGVQQASLPIEDKAMNIGLLLDERVGLKVLDVFFNRLVRTKSVLLMFMIKNRETLGRRTP